MIIAKKRIKGFYALCNDDREMGYWVEDKGSYWTVENQDGDVLEWAYTKKACVAWAERNLDC